jgi:hypothetical protein
MYSASGALARALRGLCPFCSFYLCDEFAVHRGAAVPVLDVLCLL